MFRISAVVFCSLIVLVSSFPADETKPAQPSYKVEAPIDQPSGAVPIPQYVTPQQGNSNQSPARQGRIFFPLNGITSALAGNPSLSSVLTLNLNNLALVAVFLIGVFVLLPSIVGFFTGLTGAPLGRSLNDDHPQPSYIWSIMRTLDNALAMNNIDVRVCLERAACNVAKNTARRSRDGNQSTFESVINYAINSNYGQTLLSSYRLKDAADRGRNGEDCDSYYNKCPYSLNNLSKLIATYMGGMSTLANGMAAMTTTPIPEIVSTLKFF